MCGILGVAGPEIPGDSALDQSLHTLRSRGPDGQSIFRRSGCVLGNTRLAIVDLVHGAQPMHDAAHGISITFNGELYNHEQLRKILQKLGHRFSTQSDTEVVLRAYAEYGEGSIPKLEGMFAFALWD
jgi:asparagine synthase (glutamine-hydrolysing)